MNLVEKLARKMCEVEGVDPDAFGYGLGVSMPVDSKYRLWEARVKYIEAIMPELSSQITDVIGDCDPSLKAILHEPYATVRDAIDSLLCGDREVTE